MLQHLRESVHLLFGNFILFLSLTICLGWPPILLDFISYRPFIAVLILLVLTLALSPLQFGAMLIAVSQLKSGKPVDIKSVILDSMAQWLSLILLSCIMAVPFITVIIPFSHGFFPAVTPPYIFLAFLFAAPSVYILLRFSFSWAIVVLEEANPITACTRSWELTKGYLWKIVFAGFVAGLIHGVSSGTVYALQASSWTLQETFISVWEIFIMVVASIPHIYVFLLYWEARGGEFLDSGRLQRSFQKLDEAMSALDVDTAE